MEKKIDATENPSRLENASARALSADRSEQASRPGTFSTMMSDRVIFSSASARIVAAEQVKGNKIAAMKPGADTSLASAANWKTTNGSNLSFGNFHGKSCMKTVGAGSSAGVWLDYFEDAPLCSQGRQMATSVDVLPRLRRRFVWELRMKRKVSSSLRNIKWGDGFGYRRF